MPDNSLCRYAFTFALLGSFLVSGGAALAIDPRFELDPGVLDRKVERRPADDRARASRTAGTVRRKSTEVAPPAKRRLADRTEPDAPGAQGLRMFNNVAGAPGTTDVRTVLQVWDRIVPSSPGIAASVEIRGENYSLSLDPERFPSLQAADGGTILIDAGGKLPPLVRSLIQAKGERIRIVDADPSDRKRFYSSLLAAGNFFSVVENFRVDFGDDPQLTVTSDFKLEKHQESLAGQDLLLLNVSESRKPVPLVLQDYLAKNGFSVLEPYQTAHKGEPEKVHQLFQITSNSSREMADHLMSALDIRYRRDASVELFGPADKGLRLDVRADRYFEKNGERYLVSYFNGDPVFYTLMRLLETRGYRVIILEEKDDFRKVADKFLNRLRLPASYAKHRLWPDHDLSYGVRMTGYLLNDPASGKNVFLSGKELDPLVAELARQNGYKVARPQEQ